MVTSFDFVSLGLGVAVFLLIACYNALQLSDKRNALLAEDNKRLQAELGRIGKEYNSQHWENKSMTLQIKRYQKLVLQAVAARTEFEINAVKSEYDFLISLNNGKSS